MTTTDSSLNDLIDEVETIAEHSKKSPGSVASELSYLVEVLRHPVSNEDELSARADALRAIKNVAEYDPVLLREQYPDIVEATLDTTEGRVLARCLLHESVQHIRNGVPPQTVAGGIEESLDKAGDVIVNLSDSISQERDVSGRVPSGGGTAIHVYMSLMDSKDLVEGYEQSVVESSAVAAQQLAGYYAKSVGIVPRDAVLDLKSEYQHTTSPFTEGFNSDGELTDTIESGGKSARRTVRHFLDGFAAAIVIVNVERTEPQLLRTEAIISDRIA